MSVSMSERPSEKMDMARRIKQLESVPGCAQLTCPFGAGGQMAASREDAMRASPGAGRPQCHDFGLEAVVWAIGIGGRTMDGHAAVSSCHGIFRMAARSA